MSIYARILMIVALMPILVLVSSGSSAQVKSDAQKKQELEAAKVCTQECGKKHGTGKKNQEYDSAGYEACMIECSGGKNPAASPKR